MPQFIYAPDGADPKRWEYLPDKMMSPEAEAIEKVTGMTWGEFKSAITRDSMLAIRALLWTFLRRAEPTLRFESVQFAMDDVSFEYTDDEWRVIRDSLAEVLRAGQALSDQGRDLYGQAVAAIGEPDPVDPDEPATSASQLSVSGDLVAPDPAEFATGGGPEEPAGEEAPKAE